MSKLLSAVTRAATRRADADLAYRQAIAAARPEHTLEEIGRAAGLTKQGVRYLLYPDPRKTQADD
jgi:hypothetical protein